MWMAMLAGGLLGAANAHLQSLQGAVNTNQQMLNQYAGQLAQTRQQTYALSDLTARDNAIVEANTQNTILANYKAGILQMQQAQQLQANATQGQGIREAGLEALAAAQVTSAASQSVGSSVTAVAQDIKQQADDALIKNQENADVIAQNYRTSMHALYANLNNALQIPQVGRSSDFNSLIVPDLLHGESWGSALLQGFTGVAADYATDYMTLGLGSDQGGSAGQLMDGSGGWFTPTVSSSFNLGGMLS